MPFTIHHEAGKKQMFYNVSRPQEQVPDVLPDDFRGTNSQGLPVKQIPHYDFPRVVYMHPRRPTREVVHRNAAHEIVETELVPTEHLTKVVGCEAHVKSGGPQSCRDCKKALESALAEGWVLEPYLPEPQPKSNDDLYGPSGE